jgi:Tfp pilus assembly protein PilN
MIDINLIPPALRKKSAGGLQTLAIKIPQEILWGVGGVLVMLIIAGQLVLSVMWGMGFEHMAHARAEWQKVSSDKIMLDAISSEAKALKKKTGVISDMTANKNVVWSQKFNAISDALPRGIWLRRISLDRSGLTLEGSAVSKDHNEISNVGNFVSALKRDDAFIKDFSSLEVNSIQRGKKNSIEVADFTVVAKLKAL